MKTGRLWLCFALLSLLLLACNTQQPEVEPAYAPKVAVLMERGEQVRWQRTGEWALHNIAMVQKGMDSKIVPQLIYKCQDDADIEDYMRQIARDTSIVAVIGPTTSAAARRMVQVLGENKPYKPMLSPTATDVDYQRMCAGLSYVWNMAESDIAQLEVLMSDIASIFDTDKKSLILLAADDGVGGMSRNAYAEWFGFLAEEYGQRVENVILYKTEDDIRRAVRSLCTANFHTLDKILLFDPVSVEDALAFDDEIGRIRANSTRYIYQPRICCSDAFVSERIAATVCNADYEGVDLYAAPESGFIHAYRQNFDSDIVNGEAQFYDAVWLVTYALTLSRHTGQKLTDAMLSVVEGRETATSLQEYFNLLSQGICPDLTGASGSLTFDEQTHTGICGSTFRRWRLYNGKYVTTEYVSTEGSRRTSSSKQMWEWTASRMQTFAPELPDTLSYVHKDDRWALLVAASKGWGNYRFQADVFAMYQILRRHGYDEDHIMLICEDDIAGNQSNKHKGEIRVSDAGENLYNAAAVDYRLSSVSPSDIAAIMQGKASERLPHVLMPDSNDNVFVFWSGHGYIDSLDFGGNRAVAYSEMHNILRSIPHRKMLVATEACYSGGLGEYCEGKLDGVLFITAANPYETSHADVWSKDLGVYMSNGFTRGFQEAIDNNPEVSIRDLYYTLARNTSGSHVRLYNISKYGNVYSDSMAEYLK